MLSLALGNACIQPRSQCIGDSDCGPRETCVKNGGILFSGGRCISRAWYPDGSRPDLPADTRTTDLGPDTADTRTRDGNDAADGGDVRDTRSRDTSEAADADGADTDTCPDAPGCPCNYDGKTAGVCSSGTLNAQRDCEPPPTYESPEASCADGRDNDCDGAADANDDDCILAPGANCNRDARCRSNLCGSNGRCAHRAFVSSEVYNGDFGGLSGADAICQTLADSTGLGGTWKAVMSATNNPARDRIAVTGPVARVDGTAVADGATHLWAAARQLLNPIVLNESGTKVDVCDTCDYRFAWTGTRDDGTVTTPRCDDWTAGSQSAPGGVGGAVGSTQQWLDANPSGPPFGCIINLRIYCIDGQ